MPTYRPKEYLYECIQSIYAQTFTNQLFELIIVLNGCNEPYYSNIKAYIEKHHDQGINIRMVQTDMGGVSNARNIGLDNAKGQYIVFVDDDDILSSNYLVGLYSKADDSSIVVSNEKTFVLDESGNKILNDDYISRAYNKSINKSSKSLFYNRSFLSSACCKLIPMSIISNRRFDNNFTIGEDSLFMASISDKIRNIRLSEPDVLYYRRVRPDSAIRSYRSMPLRIKNCIRSWGAYLRIYFDAPFRYNIPFFMSRFVAVFIRDIINK